MSDVLKDELVNDPLVWGYNGPGVFNVGPGPMTDQEVADVLNTIHPSPDTRTRPRQSMTGRQVRGQVVTSEYDVLSADKKAQFIALTASDDLDPFGLPADIVKDIFGSGSVTVTNLATARVEDVSRAAERGLSRVGEGDVWDVRNG